MQEIFPKSWQKEKNAQEISTKITVQIPRKTIFPKKLVLHFSEHQRKW
jgi:hypothetical protein